MTATAYGGQIVTQDFFSEVSGRISFGGLESSDPLTCKVYEPDRLVLGKRMEDHLRIAVCLWHSFNSSGSDVFGSGTFDRPWLESGLDPLAAGRARLDAAFEFIAKLGVPFYCFHDRDMAPEVGTNPLWAGRRPTGLSTTCARLCRRRALAGHRSGPTSPAATATAPEGPP